MFFHLAGRLTCADLSDINLALTRTYIAVADQLDEVLKHLRLFQHQTSEMEFYQHRKRFNELHRDARDQVGFDLKRDVELAAQLIYLNKTCFNGLFRVNRAGDFNVPYGRYKSPRVLEEDKLLAAQDALGNAGIFHIDFEEVQLSERTFLYLDPPYDPLSETSNFRGYTSSGFQASEQKRLARCIRHWDREGHKIMLSQSDTPQIRELYRGFNITEICAARSVAAQAASRTSVGELVIRNYD